ncbi:hypothetical protein BKI52_03435 [marine bacterium AO1-C]|nr:hypothetical protein BKI52_03435 [marine bacterium AO1-C]
MINHIIRSLCLLFISQSLFSQAPNNINYLKNLQYFKAQKLGDQINSAYDEAYPVVSPDGKTLYFTRAGHPNNVDYDDDRRDQDIWYTTRASTGQWSPAKNIGLPVNANNTSLVNMPNINTLIIWGAPLGYTGVKISQKMAKGWSRPRNFYRHLSNQYKIAENIFVGSDLKTIVVSKKGDLLVVFKKGQEWSNPVHLGGTINTDGKESVAFLAPDNKTLYFASNGHPGFGGSDLFVSRRLDDTWKKWSKPINLGPTINTPDNESGLYMPASGTFAYFHRGDRKKGRDIYRVKMPTKLRSRAVVLVKGKVRDATTKQPIGTNISYRNLANNVEVGYSTSDPKDGSYEVALPSGGKYSYFAQKKGYYAISENIDLTKLAKYREIKVDLLITPIEKGVTIRLNNLFFATNSIQLQKESFAELNRLATTLEQYPKMIIQIAGHTDNQGNAANNRLLSQQRAQSVCNYLLGKGIDSTRMKVKGFGASQSIAPNTTAAGRKRNRRVEFKILEKGE